MTPAQTYLDRFGKLPERILMLKGHSAGIGDLLRSSAAWRALKNAFPKTELHLALFTGEPGYASESLIARHHLLHGFLAVDKRMGRLRGWPRLSAWAAHAARTVRPDLVIDFEPAGLYSAFAAWRLGHAGGAVTAGIGQFPLRGAFYDLVSVSTAEFARRRGLEFPLEYTGRDFVCLSALQIERNGLPIELEETDEGRIFRESFREKFRLPPDATIIGVNIGCGTPDAVVKRPSLRSLCRLVEEVQKAHDAVIVLTGANFERAINQEFAGLWPPSRKHLVHDLAGQTSLLELAGLIRACALFISTDSGPYHMAVALGVPTLAVFRGSNPVHYHREKHVRCVVLGKEEHVACAIQAAAELLPLGGGLAAGGRPWAGVERPDFSD
ncbi:MAG: glycosyltransferase family 9 protein [Verrucomicrobiota bacterium]|jgi:ADP-heptose:LPS heptosyltransferase